MKTRYLNAEDPGAVNEAAEILRNGGLVAVPTETVYGLAANALDGKAVSRIFEAKGRPQDNPLIVHVSSLDEIPPLVSEVDPRVYDLAEAFWPGPLTVIMKKSELIPDEVCAGLDTVAIRMPSHPVARAVIKASGVPLAAPSANASGKPSPTRASHVRDDLDGKIECILDAGECSIGVESTVITLVTDPPTLLRPGGVTPEELESVLGKINISHAVYESLGEGEKAQSPGMKYKHYAPAARVTLIKGSFDKYEKYLKAHKTGICAVCFEGEGKHFPVSVEYGRADDSLTQARSIFDALRKVDETGCDEAFVRCPCADGVGLAVYNRLLRSSAFRVTDLDFSIPVYGITGQTGAGKSTVCSLFEKAGFHTVDTDLIAREAVRNPEVIENLKKAFGSDIFSDGELNRRELARRAFESEEKTNLLNSITHPVITELAIKEIHEAARNGAKAALIDAPVLLESPLAGVCDKIICVTADRDTRLQRIMQRDGIGIEDAELRIKAQRGEEYYTSHSDIEIRNVKPGEAVLQVENILKEKLL